MRVVLLVSAAKAKRPGARNLNAATRRRTMLGASTVAGFKSAGAGKWNGG
jgi:hypothetical protein